MHTLRCFYLGRVIFAENTFQAPQLSKCLFRGGALDFFLFLLFLSLAKCSVKNVEVQAEQAAADSFPLHFSANWFAATERQGLYKFLRFCVLRKNIFFFYAVSSELRKPNSGPWWENILITKLKKYLLLRISLYNLWVIRFDGAT